MDVVAGTAWYWYAIIGIAGGLLSGALGVGGGIIIVPALVIGLSFAQKSAQGISLMVIVPMALAGAIRYYINPDIKIDLSAVWTIIPFAIVGALIGTSIAGVIPGPILKKCFAVFIIFAGVRMLMK